MSINDRIRAMAKRAGADAIELRETLVRVAIGLDRHLDDVVAAAEQLQSRFTSECNRGTIRLLDAEGIDLIEPLIIDGQTARCDGRARVA